MASTLNYSKYFALNKAHNISKECWDHHFDEILGRRQTSLDNFFDSNGNCRLVLERWRSMYYGINVDVYTAYLRLSNRVADKIDYSDSVLDNVVGNENIGKSHTDYILDDILYICIY